MGKTTVIQEWKESATKDEILKKELSFPVQKLQPFFETPMEFGTAGIRGIMGAGTNKMNEYTVAAAAQAYADYLISINEFKKGVVIGHDNRHNSKLFTSIASSVLEQNNIKSFIYEDNKLMPTPFVSYTIRKLKLNGGIVITASHNPKEYNGFKVYNKLGAQLESSHTKIIQSNMAKINPLTVKRSTVLPKEISSSIENEYLEKILKNRYQVIGSPIKVAFSAQHGTAHDLAPKLIESSGNYAFIDVKQNKPDPDFSFTKTPNPENGMAYRRIEKVARKNKADVIATTDPDADRLGIAVRYKKRYKFLNGNQMATVYLNYMFTQLKKKKMIPKNGYIVTTVVSSTLPEKIARKFGIRTVKTHVGFKNIADVIEKEKGQFIFAFEESYGFLLDSNLARDKDSFQALSGIMEMVGYYKSKGVNTYDKLQEIYSSYGIHRTKQISKVISGAQQKRLFKKMLSSKYIGDKKVISKIDYRKKVEGYTTENLVTIKFDDGSSVSVRPSGTEPKVKIYIENVSHPNAKILDIISFEKEVDVFVSEQLEEFEDKKWSWKAFLKYVFFIGIIIGIMVFVFQEIYQTNSKTSSSNVPIFTVAQSVIRGTNRSMWLIVWGYWIFSRFLGGWMKKRMFMRLGEKVKIRHIVVSQIMGSVIGFITPFAIGGDAIGYWYLRRKGVKKAPLVASLSAATIWGEVKFALETIFLVAIGWKLYQQVFNSGDIQAHAALIWFFVGLAWSYFAAIMLLILTTSRRIQEFIVTKSAQVLEWLPFIHFYDPEGKEAAVQYDFKLIRSGMRKLYNKWWFVLEMMAYDIVPMLFAPYALVLMDAGYIDPQAPAGQYWSYVVGGDIIGTANSMSLTPGGSGTQEWLNITIRNYLYSGGGLSSKYDGKTIASGIDLADKIIFVWPELLISSITIFTTMLLVRKKPFRIFSGKRKNILVISGIAIITTSILLMIFLI